MLDSPEAVILFTLEVVILMVIYVAVWMWALHSVHVTITWSSGRPMSRTDRVILTACWPTILAVIVLGGVVRGIKRACKGAWKWLRSSDFEG